jgi:hypothetical protein
VAVLPEGGKEKEVVELLIHRFSNLSTRAKLIAPSFSYLELLESTYHDHDTSQSH